MPSTKGLLPSLFAAVLLASCGGPTSSYPTLQGGQFGGRPVVGLSNGSSLVVTLVLNGEAVGSASPEAGMEPIDFAKLPPLPWTIEARSASGRVLTSMTVNAGDVTADSDSSGGLSSSKGTMGRVDLSCGRITIWAGYSQPSGPFPPSPAGSPGDCEP
jgi:hypothetical protein